MIALSTPAHGGTYREARMSGVAGVIVLRKEGNRVLASCADGWFLAMGDDWEDAARRAFIEKGVR